MVYSHECPICGANLDPGERCECVSENHRKDERRIQNGRNDGSAEKHERSVCN